MAAICAPIEDRFGLTKERQSLGLTIKAVQSGLDTTAAGHEPTHSAAKLLESLEFCFWLSRPTKIHKPVRSESLSILSRDLLL